MIQKNLKGLEKIEVLIFVGNKYNRWVHTARNAKVTSTRNVYEKIVMKCKKEGFQRRTVEHLQGNFVRKS